MQRQQEAYDTALQTRQTIEGLLEQETLVGTIERDTIAKVKTDLASIRKVADSTDNNELRILVGELGPKLTEIVNKSNTQLKLEGHCSLSSSDSNAKPKVVAISSNLKLALPTFDGDVLNWREFWSLFSDVLFKDRGLTDTEKCCHLINSMSTPEAKEQAKSAVAYTTSYAEATDRLKAIYERNRLVFSHRYKAIFASDLINCTRKDLQRAMDKIERHCLGMRQANGYTADQMVAIHFEQCMSSKLFTAWRQFTYDQTDPPTTSDLLQFLRRQSLSAPDDKPSHSPKQSSPKQERILHPKHRLIQRKTVLKMQLTPDKCITCNAEHPLYLCTGFKKLTLEKKLDVVKRNKLCYNCLSSRHLSSTCKSKSNCKECGVKHHTLLHIMSPTSDAEGAAGNVNLVRPGFKQVKGNTLSLARTVLTLVISDEQRRRARAILDTGATIPLITKQLSNTLRATRVSNSATVIQGLSGHCYSPYKVNLTLKSLYSEEFLTVKAHVVDEIPAIPSHINMQDLCSKPFLKDLQLADPDYKPGSKIDILLGIQQCNHSSKHGVSLSSDKDWKAEETIFGWAYIWMGSWWCF